VPDDAPERVEAWLRYADGRAARATRFYTNRYWAQDHGMVANPFIAGHPLWLAGYQDAQPPTIAGWTGPYVLWQYTSEGSVPGIAGNVDLNVVVHVT
jgi:GH25 family lysozyme M1 (1,4-beta-N-acetylmuramidase)